MLNVSIKKNLIRSILVATLSATLAACSSGPGVLYPPADEGMLSKGYDVNSKTVSQTMALGTGEAGLAPGELEKLTHFARQFIKNGSGYFTIIVPEGGNRIRAEANAEELRNHSERAGLRSEELNLLIAKLDQQKGPVIMSYQSYSVKLRQCGKHFPNASYNPENRVSPDHACSIMNNIALMTSNPADLVGGRNPGRTTGSTSSPELEALRLGKSPGNYSHDFEF
jgi:pilus biogenesis lipoprotein CpaD